MFYWNDRYTLSTLEYIIAPQDNHFWCAGNYFLWSGCFAAEFPAIGLSTHTLKCPGQNYPTAQFRAFIRQFCSGYLVCIIMGIFLSCQTTILYISLKCTYMHQCASKSLQVICCIGASFGVKAKSCTDVEIYYCSKDCLKKITRKCSAFT